MFEDATGLLLYIALKLTGYSIWSYVGLRWLGDPSRATLTGALARGVGRLLIGWGTGIVVAPFAIAAVGSGHVTMFYVTALPVVRWFEWAIIHATVAASMTGTRFLDGLNSRGRLWRLGGIAVSYLADLPFLISEGGLPHGRIFC